MIWPTSEGALLSQAQRRAAADIVAAIRADLRKLSVTTTAAVRAVRRRYSKALIDAPAETVVAAAGALLVDRNWPERLIGSELLVARRDAMRHVNGTLVDRWADGLADWGSIDMYGVTVAGVAWREARISDSRVMRWAHSPDRWHRRLALVATVPLNSRARGGLGETARTLRVCRTLVDDRDDMVVKALSWALRELSKRDPDGVARFIREEDSRLAACVRREVKAKLETGRKRQPGM